MENQENFKEPRKTYKKRAEKVEVELTPAQKEEQHNIILEAGRIGVS